MNRPPPCSTNRLSRSVGLRRERGRVVEHDDGAAARSCAGVTREAGTTSVLNGGAVPIDKRGRQIEARRFGRRAVGLDDQHRHRPARRQHEMEVVVRRERVRAGPDRAAHARLGHRDRANVTEPDAFGPIVTCRVSTTRPSISSCTGCAVTARRAAIGQAGRDRDALFARERRRAGSATDVTDEVRRVRRRRPRRA